jgi:phage tail P2-like protein
MSNLSNTKLIDLLPPNLKSDPDIIAASHAVGTEFQTLVGKIKNVLTIADIDNACSEVVDNLAWDLCTDFYDASLPLEIRRKLIKNALIQHMTKGTPAAVEEVLYAYFGSGIVKEWFNYGGQPGCFKAQVTNASIQSKQINDIYRAIASTKRASSQLDELLISADMPNNGTSTIILSSATQAQNEMIHPPDPVTMSQGSSSIVLSSTMQAESEMTHPPDPITLAQKYSEMIISQAHMTIIQ